MKAETFSLGLHGLEAHLLRVRAARSEGPAGLQLLGLPGGQARESRVRIGAALQQLGVQTHQHAVTITLAPTTLATGEAGDLAMAVAVLLALGLLPADAAKSLAMIGELSTTCAIRPVKGVLPRLQGAAKLGVSCVVVPAVNAQEATLVSGLRIHVADHLHEVIEHLHGVKPLPGVESAPELVPVAIGHDLGNVRGLGESGRALEVAAAGGHDLLLIGSPGATKTGIARRLPSLLPPTSREEALEVTSHYSVAGLLSPQACLIQSRPFRAPHFSVSAAGLLGGGDPVRPGEVSLAHQGVLFLDELDQFRRSNLEALARALEEEEARIWRGRQWITFPAKTLLVGAVFPCSCGFWGTSRCTCSPEARAAFQERLNGPLWERIDLRVMLPVAEVASLQGDRQNEPWRVVQGRVARAHARQGERARKLSPRVLNQATERLGLSKMDQRRVLRVARTVADLEESDVLAASHLAEAIHLTANPFSSNTATRSRGG